jgi:hypothetical protein
MPQPRFVALLSKGLLLALFLYVSAATLSTACTGADPCLVCKNCKYCKHCAKDGGTCGVCKKRSAA